MTAPHPLRLVFVGLSLSSSWGNGHATTYRALLKALGERGHDVLFLERDRPWYARHRDLAAPDYCRLALYDSLADLDRYLGAVGAADAVVLGSFTPEGVEVARTLRAHTVGPLFFYDIDTPVTLAALERGDCEYLSADVIPTFDAYLSFTGGPTLDHLMDGLGARQALPFFCSVDEDAFRPSAAVARWDLSYLGTYSADRQPGLERLLLEPARAAPELRFAVAGSGYPDGLEWPANVERIHHVTPPDLPGFYAASRFTLNLTRADMVAAGHSPSVRLFEAAACACPIVSDRWDGLVELFGDGVLIADGADDVLAAVRDWPETQAAAMAHRARSIVLEGHTARRRAAEFERYVEAARSRGSASTPRPTHASMRMEAL